MSNEEFDKLRDHKFDGIEEYDNPLPRWWKNIFWGSIVFSVFYVIHYHVGLGESVEAEYSRTVSQVLAAQQKFEQKQLKKLNEAFFIKLEKDASMIQKGEKLFKTGECIGCHGMKAEGNIGPNLTDRYAKHKPSRLRIFQVIQNGVPGTTMTSFKSKYSTQRLYQLTLYVRSLLGTDVKGKKPEGKFYFTKAGKIEKK